MKSLWRCCTCLFLLLLGILVALGILIVLLLTPRSAHAQTFSGGCATFEAPTQALTLSAAIPRSPSSSTARGIFFTRVITVTLPHNTCVVLASTPDGRGNVWVDDALSLQVQHSDGSFAQVTQDFRAADHARIVAVAPLDWTSFFSPGDNRVTLTLHDLSPDVYGSSALWLVIFAPPYATATTSPMILTPTATLFLHTPTPVSVVTTDSAAHPSPIPSTVPPTFPTGLGAPSALAIVGGGALGAVLLALAIARRPARQVRRVASLHPGTLDLFDLRTFESVSIELADWSNGFVVLSDPLRIEPPRQGDGSLFHVTPCAEGIQLSTNGTTEAESLLLRSGDSTTIGTIKLSLETHTAQAEN